MTVYGVMYDLIDETSGHDYKPLWAEFARLGAHKTQYSMYLLNATNTPKEIVEHFKRFVDRNDRIWVIEIRKDRYWYIEAIDGTNAWLKANPPA